VLLVEKIHCDADQSSVGHKGRFWHEESFDHLVRTPEQFEYLRRYIADNPNEAMLRAGEYLYQAM